VITLHLYFHAISRKCGDSLHHSAPEAPCRSFCFVTLQRTRAQVPRALICLLQSSSV
jgi:hypothetical protein